MSGMKISIRMRTAISKKNRTRRESENAYRPFFWASINDNIPGLYDQTRKHVRIIFSIFKIDMEERQVTITNVSAASGDTERETKDEKTSAE